MISPPSSTGPAAFYFKAARLPMLWAACAYGLGVIFGKYEWRPTSWWFVSIAVFIAAAAYFSSRRSRLAWLLALGSFFLAGALHIQLRASSERLDTTILPYADRQKLEVTAHVTSDGRVHQNDFGETRQSVDVEAGQIRTAGGEIVVAHSGIRLNIYSPRTNSEDSLLPQPRKISLASFTTGNVCASLPSFGRRVIFEIPELSIIARTWPITASPRWVPRSSRMSNCFPDSPETELCCGEAGCIAACSKRCKRSGPRAKQLFSTRWSSATKHFSTVTLASTSSVPARTTCSWSRE